ncbi:MAG TPA: Xaa-Pro peptidase family protein [Bryobacteraceae bacterium]|nr:Xaa-Pro peptidase family protein [Bryobacteraceae bacterium]
MNLAEIQEALQREKLDGWLFFDHHERDPLAYRVLGFSPASHVTRRWYYFIPAEGEPLGLVHRIESARLDAVPGEKIRYSSWTEQVDGLRRILGKAKRVAMEYSPECAIPYVAMVDAGTVELVRGLGVDVASSAELIQHFEARWTPAALESHLEAGRRVDRVRAEAFRMIGQRTRNGGSVQELEVKKFVIAEFASNGLFAEDGPIVGVNANAANPHYEPTEGVTQPIRSGDFVLIDMWAKLNQPGSVYYDITWTGYCGKDAPSEMRKIFEIVRNARDRAVERVQSAVRSGEPVRGFQVDDAARGYIAAQGYGQYFVHRTGHSIGQDVHGNGANMDNLETHDERRIVPWTCFSIEPGIYLQNFGVRSEVNVFVDERDARVTGEMQRELVLI